MAWVVEWKNPPASAFLSERDQAIENLKAQPGRWARVRKDMKSKTGIGVWKKAGLEAVTAPAESGPELFDYFARAPEVEGPATPAPPKRRGQAPSALPAAEASPVASAAPKRVAEEDAAWEGLREDRELIVPGPPSESETSDAAKAVTAGWKGRLGHKPAGLGGRRG